MYDYTRFFHQLIVSGSTGAKSPIITPVLRGSRKVVDDGKGMVGREGKGGGLVMPVRLSHNIQPFPPLQNSFGLELLQRLWLRDPVLGGMAG